MINSKGFVLIQLLVILLLVGAGVYVWLAEVNQRLPEDRLLVSGEEETSDWQTYRNTQYGFEFKYPTDWSVVATDQPSPPYKVYLFLGESNTIQSGGTMAITVSDKTAEGYLSGIESSGSKMKTLRDDFMGGAEATRYLFERQNGTQWESYVAVKNGILFEIVSDSNGVDSFNQILSTFKFK